MDSIHESEGRGDGRLNQEGKPHGRRKDDSGDKDVGRVNKDAKDEHRRGSKRKERSVLKSGSESEGDLEKKERRRRRKHKLQEGSASESESESEDSGEREKREKKKRRKEKRRKERDESEEEESEELDRRERKRKRKEKRRQRDDKKARRVRDKRAREETDDEKIDGEKERRLLKEAKKFLKKHSKKGGQELVLSAVGRKVDPITSGDYFQKNAEFATWLREGKGIFFSDLSTDQAHSLFDSFVAVYNEGKLPDKYYDGITSTHAQRSSFAWAIRGRGETGEDVMAEEDRRASEAARSKSERKKWKHDQELLLDEMLPKASGREAVLEKKAVRREHQRGREDSPELMRDKDLLGGGDDFQQRLAREKERREKRLAAKAHAVAEKTTAYQAAENAKLDQFRALLGASGGKISIPRRAD